MRSNGWTYCGNHFAIYVYIESFCCTPKTNIMLHVNYIPNFQKEGMIIITC